MFTHIQDSLSQLAKHCGDGEKVTIKGWSVDLWQLSVSAIDAVVKAYKKLLLIDTLEKDVVQILKDDGIDIDELLLDREASVNQITRSDLTELLAAASLIARENLSGDKMLLANVPKGQRSVSNPGVDILAAKLFEDDTLKDLQAGEHLYVCSVKHTISDPSDLRYKLVKSLMPPHLTIPYLISQVRLLNGRLSERGRKCDRIFLTLVPGRRGEHLKLLGCAAYDLSLDNEFMAQMQNLPEVTEGGYSLRRLAISEIEALHTRI
jgi:hypothetical protein